MAEQPWLENKKWQSNQIRSDALTGLWFYWGFSTVWLLICLPILFNAGQLQHDIEPIMRWLLWAFPLAGLWMLYSAIKKTIQWRRFGPTPLSLSPFPGSIGGEVGGTIQVSLPLPKGVAFKVTLSNLYTYTSGSGKSRSTKHRAEWQDSQQVIPTSDPSGSQIHFKFAVPDDCHPTEPARSDGYHHWQLAIDSCHPTIELQRSYRIPVFRLAEAAYSSVTSQVVEENLQQGEFVQSTPQADGLHMNYPMFRNLSFSLVFSLMGLVFAGLGLFFIFGDSDVPLIMGLAFFPIGSLLAIFGLYMLGSAYQVKVDMQGVHLKKQWFLWRWQQQFPVAQVKGFRKKKGGQSSSGNQVQVFYTIQLIDQHDKATTIGDSITSASQADRLIKQIEAALNGATLDDYN